MVGLLEVKGYCGRVHQGFVPRGDRDGEGNWFLCADELSDAAEREIAATTIRKDYRVLRADKEIRLAVRLRTRSQSSHTCRNLDVDQSRGSCYLL